MCSHLMRSSSVLLSRGYCYLLTCCRRTYSLVRDSPNRRREYVLPIGVESRSQQDHHTLARLCCIDARLPQLPPMFCLSLPLPFPIPPLEIILSAVLFFRSSFVVSAAVLLWSPTLGRRQHSVPLVMSLRRPHYLLSSFVPVLGRRGITASARSYLANTDCRWWRRMTAWSQWSEC